MSDGKHAVGLKGFPTTNTANEIESYLLFLFPDDEWAQWILGALEPMVYGDNWYESGDMSTDESAEQFRQIIEQAPYNIRFENVPAPYWDEESADDADDEAPRDDQPWYGVLIDDNLTWVENVGFWAITAFVAIAATPAAAIAFVPVARRFTVAFKKHDLGGIVRAFIDGAEVGAADTYSASDSVGEMTIVMPEEAMGLLAFDTPHTLWLSMSEDFNPAVDGAPNIQLLRKRLTETDVIPSNQRYNPDTDTVQFSPDGGATWVDMPSLDPRISSAFLLPSLGSDVRCDAAANMVKWMKDFLDQMTALLGEGATAFQLANIAIPIYELISGGSLTLLAIITEIGATLFSLGYTALLAAMDSTAYDALLCCFFCNISDNGQCSIDQLIAVENQVTADLNTTAGIVVNALLFLQGSVGLSNAGAIGSETGDCDGCTDCAWCYQFNSTHRLSEWTAEGWAGSPDTLPVYSDGVWQSGYFNNGGHNGNYVHIRYVFDETIHLTDAGAYSSDMPDNRNIWMNGDGSLFSGTRIWNNGTWEGGAGVDANSIDAIFWRNIDQGVNPFSLEWVQISGDASENPIGENNC